MFCMICISCSTKSISCYFKVVFMFFEQHFMFLCNAFHVSKVVFQNMRSAFHVENNMLKVYHFMFFVHVLVQR
jgi:hypothetical protein